MHKLLISSLLFLFLLLSGCNAEPQLGLAPDFTLVDGHSKSFNLTDYRGKGVIVIFWATWCPYCARIMPSLEKYYQQYNKNGLEIIAVDIMEDGDPIAHMKNKGFSYRLGLDGDKVAEQWQVTGTPTLFFINKKGFIVAKNQISDPNSAVIRQLIQQILE